MVQKSDQPVDMGNIPSFSVHGFMHVGWLAGFLKASFFDLALCNFT